jgi:predicted TIM-barrel fold metal-dependent hydrolase
MPRFDVHQHFWPEQLIEALRRRSELPRLRGTVLELDEGSFETDLTAHGLDRRLELLDRYELDVAVISLQPTVACEQQPDLAQAYHEGIAQVVEASNGRLVALACGERRDGFVGACVSARRVVSGIAELAAELAQADQMLFVHPGYPAPAPAGAPPWWAAIVDYTAQMQAAYAAWLANGNPELCVVFAMLAGGGPFQLERVPRRGGELADAYPNIYLDTSSYGRRALELCARACGNAQLVHGSDAPVLDPGPSLEALSALGLLETAADENPARLFA